MSFRNLTLFYFCIIASFVPSASEEAPFSMSLRGEAEAITDFHPPKYCFHYFIVYNVLVWKSFWRSKLSQKAVNRNWYNLKPAEVISSLNASSDGLSQEEAQKRLAQFGPNELVKKAKISPWLLLLEQFKNFLILILLIAAVISAIKGDVVDAILISAIVLFAGILGFIQEYEAERAMEALKRMAAPTDFTKCYPSGYTCHLPRLRLYLSP